MDDAHHQEAVGISECIDLEGTGVVWEESCGTQLSVKRAPSCRGDQSAGPLHEAAEGVEPGFGFRKHKVGLGLNGH